MCAQACRLPYELQNKALQKSLPSPGDHLLSPQDLCTVDRVDDLVAAGVASLKIEGRMKSPEYVFAVTSVYRKALDAALAKENAAITDADRDRLTDAFSRGFTTAYLDGKRGNDIMSYQRPNNRGLFLGRVDEVRDGAAYLKSAHALAEGDVLEFWTRKGNGTLTLGPVRTDKKGRYHLPLEGKTRTVKAGDRVFRVRSAEAAFEDDAREPRVPLVGTATLHIGEPLRMEFRPAAEADIEGAPRTTLAVAPSPASCLPRWGFRCRRRRAVEAARTRAVSFDDVARPHRPPWQHALPAGEPYYRYGRRRRHRLLGPAWRARGGAGRPHRSAYRRGPRAHPAPHYSARASARSASHRLPAWPSRSRTPLALALPSAPARTSSMCRL